jgi:pSer/pThr/pTyr-binding forkhead associated (FHA) protein
MCSLVGDGHRVPLGDGRHVIGRSAECDVQLTSSAVSRRHAVIEVHGPQAVLEDLRSRNGTFVRGRRITRPRELRNGDRLCIGDVELVFRLFSPMSTTHRIQLPQKLKKAVDRS